MPNSKTDFQPGAEVFSQSSAPATKRAAPQEHILNDTFERDVKDMLRDLKRQVEMGDVTRSLNIAYDLNDAPITFKVTDKEDNILYGFVLVPRKSALWKNAAYQVNFFDVFPMDKRGTFDEASEPTHIMSRQELATFKAVRSELSLNLGEFIEGLSQSYIKENWTRLPPLTVAKKPAPDRMPKLTPAPVQKPARPKRITYQNLDRSERSAFGGPSYLHPMFGKFAR